MASFFGRPGITFDRFQMGDGDLSGSADIVSHRRGRRCTVAVAERGDDLAVWMIGAVDDVATLDIELYRVRYLRSDAKPQAFNNSNEQRTVARRIDRPMKVSIVHPTGRRMRCTGLRPLLSDLLSQLSDLLFCKLANNDAQLSDLSDLM